MCSDSQSEGPVHHGGRVGQLVIHIQTGTKAGGQCAFLFNRDPKTLGCCCLNSGCVFPHLMSLSCTIRHAQRQASMWILNSVCGVGEGLKSEVTRGLREGTQEPSPPCGALTRPLNFQS